MPFLFISKLSKSQPLLNSSWWLVVFFKLINIKNRSYITPRLPLIYSSSIIIYLCTSYPYKMVYTLKAKYIHLVYISSQGYGFSSSILYSFSITFPEISSMVPITESVNTYLLKLNFYFYYHKCFWGQKPQTS